MPSILSFIFLLLSLFFISTANCSAQVVINEILHNPKAENNEWVEIYNTGSEPVNLDNYHLVDESNRDYSLADLEEVGAKSFVVFEYQSGDGWLNNTDPGDTVFLENNDTEVDSYNYNPVEEGKSIGRSPDGSETWITFDTPSKGESNTVPTDTPIPTQEVTNTPLPTDEPANNEPEITATISDKDSIRVGVKFYVDIEIKNFEDDTDYYAKVRIGQETNDMDMGRTEVNGDWLHDTAGWDSFPVINNDKTIWTLRAKVKEGSSEGKYYLKVVAKKKNSDDQIHSPDYEFEADPEPTPIPTEENSPTPTPTKNESSNSDNESEISLTATKKPTSDLTPTPTPTENEDKVLGIKSKRDQSSKDQEDRAEVLDDTSLNKTYLKNKAISLGLVSIGGLFISSVWAWPYIRKIFATMKKDE